VVASGGSLGGFGGEISQKKALLEAEGIRFRGTRISDFTDVRFTSFRPA